jgi:hypothetical protein
MMMRYGPGEAVNENVPFAFVVATTFAAAPCTYGAIATETPERPTFDAKSTTVPDAAAEAGVGVAVGVGVGDAVGVALALGVAVAPGAVGVGVGVCAGVAVAIGIVGCWPGPLPPPLHALRSAVLTTSSALFLLVKRR